MSNNRFSFFSAKLPEFKTSPLDPNIKSTVTALDEPQNSSNSYNYKQDILNSTFKNTHQQPDIKPFEHISNNSFPLFDSYKYTTDSFYQNENNPRSKEPSYNLDASNNTSIHFKNDLSTSSHILANHENTLDSSNISSKRPFTGQNGGFLDSLKKTKIDRISSIDNIQNAEASLTTTVGSMTLPETLKKFEHYNSDEFIGDISVLMDLANYYASSILKKCSKIKKKFAHFIENKPSIFIPNQINSSSDIDTDYHSNIATKQDRIHYSATKSFISNKLSLNETPSNFTKNNDLNLINNLQQQPVESTPNYATPNSNKTNNTNNSENNIKTNNTNNSENNIKTNNTINSENNIKTDNTNNSERSIPAIQELNNLSSSNSSAHSDTQKASKPTMVDNNAITDPTHNNYEIKNQNSIKDVESESSKKAQNRNSVDSFKNEYISNTPSALSKNISSNTNESMLLNKLSTPKNVGNEIVASNFKVDGLNICNNNSREVIYDCNIKINKAFKRKPRGLLIADFYSNGLIDTPLTVSGALDGSVQFWNTKTQKLYFKGDIMLSKTQYPEHLSIVSPNTVCASLFKPTNDPGDTKLKNNDSSALMALISIRPKKSQKSIYKVNYIKKEGVDRNIFSTTSVNINGLNSAQRSVFVSGGLDKRLDMWDITFDSEYNYNVDQIVQIPSYHSSAIQSVTFDKSRAYLFSGGADCRLQVTNLHTNCAISTHKYTERINHLVLHPENPNLLMINYASKNKQFRLIDLRAPLYIPKTALEFGFPSKKKQSRYMVPSFHPSGNFVISGLHDTSEGEGGLFLWDIRFAKVNTITPQCLSIHNKRVLGSQFVPGNKNLLVTISTDKTLTFTDFKLALSNS
ncbi:hypothetical protein BB561_001245 [Smittium simulii]|uniref:Uncharacterized protein n=1 Tax=Smittium simulii TaxID=133385 RepID=A0A2T9YVG2_9FUNG|nr:hypothetical protein BB561_001245 [Smittium simulii]